MGLGFGLEKGDVHPDDLAKARQMVPRALEQYVTQLAENGPGSCSGIPAVSDPVILKNAAENENGDERILGNISEPESESDDVDIA